MFQKHLLSLLLYNDSIKRIANELLSKRYLISNPIYLYLQKIQIDRVINQYKNKPFSLRIENTNACNARCFMCPHSVMKRKQGIMSMELYKHLIDQAVEMKIDYINLHNFGEPLVDRKFCEKVRYAKSQGIKRVSTNTNGQLLTRELVKELIKSGIDEVYISVDAATKPTHQKIRIGLDFDTVEKNIHNFIKERQKMGSKLPVITLDFLETGLNTDEKQAFERRWFGVVDNICFSKIHDWSSRQKNVDRNHFDNYVSYSQAPCRLPFTELLINWDGTVSLCCQDIEGEVLVGDAKTQSLAEIWKGKKLNAIRTKQRQLLISKLPVCRNCKLRTFWWTF